VEQQDLAAADVVGAAGRGELRRVPVAGVLGVEGPPGGGLAGGFEHFRQKQFGFGDADVAFVIERAEQADAVRVAAGHEGSPGGGADRLGDEEACEGSSLTGQKTEVGRSEILGPETADVAIALVIGEEEDDVGDLGGLGE